MGLHHLNFYYCIVSIRDDYCPNYNSRISVLFIISLRAEQIISALLLILSATFITFNFARFVYAQICVSKYNSLIKF